MRTPLSIVKNEGVKDAVRAPEVAAGTGAPFSPVVGEKSRRYSRRDLTHSVTQGERGKPGICSLRGSQAARSCNGDAVEDRGESERPTVMVGIRIATLSDAKRADFPLGFRSRENLANRPNRIGR